MQSLAVMLLRSRKTPNFNAGKILAEVGQSSKVETKNEFHFHKYARTYWLHHILLLMNQNTAMTRELSRLRKPETLDTYVKREVVLEALEMAASTGQHNIIQTLVNTGWMDVDIKGKQDRTPLAWAAFGRHVEAVKVILHTKRVNVDSIDTKGQTPLSLAIGNTDHIRYHVRTME
jgi:ankyrin repeat protein